MRVAAAIGAVCAACAPLRPGPLTLFAGRDVVVRVIVTGGRGYSLRDVVFAALDTVVRELRPADASIRLVVVEGGAAGADLLARSWVLERADAGHVSETHPADWTRHGNRAGPIRNEEMVAAGAQLCLAFPGGRGTADCVRRCIAAGIPVVRCGEGDPTHAAPSRQETR